VSGRDRPQPRGSRSAPFDVSTEMDASSDAPATGPRVGSRIFLLVRRESDTHALEIAPGDELTVGRSPQASIPVDELRVSREHTAFARRGDVLVVRDLGSRNGTLVNDRRLRASERALRGGDVVRVGSLELVVAEATGASWEKSASVPSRDAPAEDESFVVADPAMVEVFDAVRRVAPTPTTVLVVGETGAGKEVVAEQIHRLSARAGGPFVRLNCAALAETLLESELFGHAKAAFTGADHARAGFFEAANGGTLLLDEVGEMSLAMQAKLLRVLETHTLTRLGETRERRVDVRIVCATHRDLEAEVAAGRFRKDLSFRIGVFRIDVPPLRARPAEIQLLARVFAERFARSLGRPTPTLTAAAMAALTRYAWPGNVRELRSAVEHALLMSEDTVGPEHLPSAMTRGSQLPPPPDHDKEAMRGRVADLERTSIVEALRASEGNRTRAAQTLGISRGALAYKIAKYRIE